MAETLEIEVKFFVDDLAAIRERVLEAGGVPSKARIFERNVCYDDADKRLLAQGSLLRLRDDGAIRLTYKGRLATDAQAASEVKVREEIELEVSDFVSAEMIFQRMGYAPSISYEKYRETFQLGTVEIVLDEMPYGNFIELEAPSEAAIRTASQQLALDWTQRITTNYLALLQAFNAYHSLEIRDLTFANFAQVEHSIVPVLHWPAR